MLNKRLTGVLAAAIAAVTVLFSVTGCSLTEKYVAKVDGQKITETEYKIILNTIKANYEQYGITDWNSKVGENKETLASLVKQQALDRAQMYKVELLKAKEAKTKLTSDEEKKAKDDLNSQIESMGGRSEADKKMKDTYGVSLTAFEEFYMNNALAEKFRNDQVKKITLTDEEVKKEYESKKDDYDFVAVRQIVFATKDSAGNDLPKDKVEAAQKNANDVLEMVKNAKTTADVEALVAKYSEDPAKTDNKGVYYFDKTGTTIDTGMTLVPQFPEWAFKAKEGDVAVVQSDLGFHVLKLEKRSTFDDVKDKLKSYMQNLKYQSDYIGKWVKESKYKLVKNTKVYDAIKVENPPAASNGTTNGTSGGTGTTP